MCVHIYLPLDRHTEIYFSGFKFAELEMSASCMRFYPYFPLILFTELVLSVLLETFIFSPGSKEIEWVMRGLAAPKTKDSEGAKRAMPLKLTIVGE